MVVGDSKQMPPTSFAEPSSGGDESTDFPETTVEDEESILSECVQARVPRQWLSWHYRSQDESLIAFSNNQYYENRLSSFPAPTHGRASAEPDGRGVSLVRVPGTFHRTNAGRLLRTNPIEAKAIVAEIRRRFDLVPKYGDGSDVVPSIGVVTFNAQQRAYIEALLRDADDDRLAAALDRADGEGLFVKNLENVQGDERDVVFFSTGFSPNARGDLPLNFGPLNRVGGERRLNVAITRARRQVVVFSSFDPEQLRAEETSSVGIKHLRAYLDLAAQGTDVLPRDARSAAVVDRHREDIAAALRERGLVVRTDVGLSEFRVDLSISRPVDPETPVMAVLLDGPAWARRRTVGDRDGLPVEVLSEMLRWPAVERVWLPSWLADPAAVADHLVASVDTVPVAAPEPDPVPDGGGRVVQGRGGAAVGGDVGGGAGARSKARREAGRAGGDGRRDAVRAVDPEDRRREVGARRAADGEGRAGGAQGAARRREGGGADPRRPADQADRRRVRAEPVERGAQAGAAVDAAAVGRGRRLPVARGRGPGRRGPGSAGRCRAPTGRSTTWRRRRSRTRWRRCAGRRPGCAARSCSPRPRRCSATSGGRRPRRRRSRRR